jgi:hypothetical protein
MNASKILHNRIYIQGFMQIPFRVVLTQYNLQLAKSSNFYVISFFFPKEAQ